MPEQKWLPFSWLIKKKKKIHHSCGTTNVKSWLNKQAKVTGKRCEMDRYWKNECWIKWQEGICYKTLQSNTWKPWFTLLSLLSSYLIWTLPETFVPNRWLICKYVQYILDISLGLTPGYWLNYIIQHLMPLFLWSVNNSFKNVIWLLFFFWHLFDKMAPLLLLLPFECFDLTDLSLLNIWYETICALVGCKLKTTVL